MQIQNALHMGSVLYCPCRTCQICKNGTMYWYGRSGPTPQAPLPCGLVSVVTFLCAKLLLVLVNLCLQCMYMKMLKAFAIPNAAIPRAGIRKLGVLTPDSRYYEANSAFHCHGVKGQGQTLVRLKDIY